MRKINIQIKTIAFLFFFVLLLSMNVGNVEAKGRYVSNRSINVKHKINGMTFVSRQYQEQGQYRCKVIMIKNGRRTVIAKDAGAEFVTNGKVLYYIHVGEKAAEYSYYKTICKYEIGSGTRTNITSGIDYSIMGATDRYLYLGRDYGADGVDLYAYDLKTNKKKHMVEWVGSIWIKNKRVITEDNTGSVANLRIYSFKLNGSDKKKIAEGGVRKVTNKEIYYVKYDFNQSNGYRYKKYICSLTGENKKAISKWQTVQW